MRLSAAATTVLAVQRTVYHAVGQYKNPRLSIQKVTLAVLQINRVLRDPRRRTKTLEVFQDVAQRLASVRLCLFRTVKQRRLFVNRAPYLGGIRTIGEAGMMQAASTSANRRW
jgi:hypothetical protein